MARLQTRKQRYSETAFACVSSVKAGDFEKFSSFAKSFPALLHEAGLCQAVAFAAAKKHEQLLQHIVHVLQVDDPSLKDPQQLAARARSVSVNDYLQLSKQVLDAAIWLKTYVEAEASDDTSTSNGEPNNASVSA